jgi:hypothetical protein
MMMVMMVLYRGKSINRELPPINANKKLAFIRAN